VRLASLVIRQPVRSEVVIARSGLRFAFHYPAQLMPLLVVFQELMDPELSLLARVLGPGRVAIDVGASIGTWTVCAAKTGATVHACEPDDENFAVLRENVVLNGLASKVVTHCVALASGEGWSHGTQSRRRYLSRFALSEGSVAHGTRVWSLDRFVGSLGLSRVDVLKVNTAGYEAEVLGGTRELFRQGKVGLALVLDGLAVRPVIDGLAEFSYQFGFYDNGQRKFIQASASSRLDDLRPGPMNRYILVKHCGLTL
jgi:FkbM family methyltransferase